MKMKKTLSGMRGVAVSVPGAVLIALDDRTYLSFALEPRTDVAILPGKKDSYPGFRKATAEEKKAFIEGMENVERAMGTAEEKTTLSERSITLMLHQSPAHRKSPIPPTIALYFLGGYSANLFSGKKLSAAKVTEALARALPRAASHVHYQMEVVFKTMFFGGIILFSDTTPLARSPPRDVQIKIEAEDARREGRAEEAEREEMASRILHGVLPAFLIGKTIEGLSHIASEHEPGKWATFSGWQYVFESPLSTEIAKMEKVTVYISRKTGDSVESGWSPVTDGVRYRELLL